MLGTNFRIASIQEQMNFFDWIKPRLNEEVLLLNTCNRCEVYISVLLRGHFDFAQCPKQSSTSLKDKEVVSHLFKVVSGLDSLIVGETQIQAQVKAAYENYSKKNKLLNRLFQKALEVGKRIRSQTNISKGALSYSQVACQVAEEKLGGLQGKKIILMGAGKINKVTAKFLAKKNKMILVANRTFNKANLLASEINGKAIRFDELEKEIADCDLLLSATAAPHFVIKKSLLNHITKPILMIDLSLPFDIDPILSSSQFVELLNLDDLKIRIEDNLNRRGNEAMAAMKIVQEEASKFYENYCWN